MSHVIYMWGGVERSSVVRAQERMQKKKKIEKTCTRWYAHKTNRREVRPERGV